MNSDSLQIKKNSRYRVFPPDSFQIQRALVHHGFQLVMMFVADDIISSKFLITSFVNELIYVEKIMSVHPFHASQCKFTEFNAGNLHLNNETPERESSVVGQRLPIVVCLVNFDLFSIMFVM